MFEQIMQYLTQLFVYGVSLDLQRHGESNTLRVKLKDFLIKHDNTTGIIVENLILTVADLVEEVDDVAKSFQDGSYVVEKLVLLLSEDWLNMIIEKDEALEKVGAKNVRVDFHGNKMGISGEFKVGIDVKAAVDLILSVAEGKLTIDIDRVRAFGKFNLPKFVQKAVIGIVHKYFSKKIPKGLSIEEYSIILDHYQFIPSDIYMDFKHVKIENNFLVLIAGADRDESLKKIAQKVSAKKAAAKKLKEEKEVKKTTGEQEKEAGITENKEEPDLSKTTDMVQDKEKKRNIKGHKSDDNIQGDKVKGDNS